jgi:DNA-directed RNA polymerase subunit E'
MYHIITIQDRVRLPAQNFSMKLGEGLRQIIRERYERRIDKDNGIILSVWNVAPTGDGVVIPSDPAAYYDVKFEALAYLPVVNEVIEAEVAELVEFGAFLQMGSLEGLVHLSQIANDFLTYNKRLPAFVGKESKKSLKKGDHVLAKISTVSVKSSLSETKIGLTMRPEGLGKEEWVSDVKAKAASAPATEAKPKKEKKEKEAKE